MAPMSTPEATNFPNQNPEFLNPTEMVTARNRLHKVGHRIRRLQDTFDSFKGPERNQQVDTAGIALLESTGNAQVVEEFLDLQMGGDMWPGDSEDLALSDIARQRMRESFERRAATLWVTTVGVTPTRLRERLHPQQQDNDFGRDKEEFQRLYNTLAPQLGLFPYIPDITAAQTEKRVDRQDRILAVQLMFLDKLAQTQSSRGAAEYILTHITRAMKVYVAYPIETLQQYLSERLQLSPEEIQLLEVEGVWSNRNDLAAMCVDRGARETHLAFYGIFRIIPAGYRLGQELLLLKSNIESSLQVTAHE